MRPTRTLPLAFSVAALAALVSGCAEEGELEPGWGAAVDALVEEVEGGLWAGEGNPLADGDPLADDGFTCTSKPHTGGGRFVVGGTEDMTECWDKCAKHAPGQRCSCTRLDDTNQWKCIGLGGGGGGGGDPLPPSLPPPSVGTPEAPPDPGGMRGGGGRKRTEEERKIRETTLACDAGKERGKTAGCKVETELETDSMWFSWSAGPEGAEKTRSGRGGDYLSWEGVATEDRHFVAMLSWGHRMLALDGTVTVEPRDWKLEEQSARTKPKWVEDIPGWPTAWGLYKGGLPTPEELPVEGGSGPWEGSHYVSEAPSITAATMYYHNDLDSAGAGPEYPIVDTIDAKVIEECAVPDSVVDAGLVGVYPLNDICGYSARVDGFRGKVIAHEERHETSLNECIDAVNTDGRLAAIEAIVKTSASDVETEAEKLWTKGAVAPLFDARETAQGPESADIWKYRPGPWKYGVNTKGHDGKEGCPKDPSEQ